MKRIPFVLLALLLSGVACSDDSEGPKKEGESDPVTLTLSDPNATEETKALYSNLWAIQSKGFMFGHHDDLMYGRTWYGTEGGSDTKAVCGDYPAVYSFDFAEHIDRSPRFGPGCPGAAAALLPGGLRPRHGARVVHSHQQSAYRRRFVGQLQQSGGRRDSDGGQRHE